MVHSLLLHECYVFRNLKHIAIARRMYGARIMALEFPH